MTTSRLLPLGILHHSATSATSKTLRHTSGCRKDACACWLQMQPGSQQLGSPFQPQGACAPVAADLPPLLLQEAACACTPHPTLLIHSCCLVNQLPLALLCQLLLQQLSASCVSGESGDCMRRANWPPGCNVRGRVVGRTKGADRPQAGGFPHHCLQVGQVPDAGVLQLAWHPALRIRSQPCCRQLCCHRVLHVRVCGQAQGCRPHAKSMSLVSNMGSMLTSAALSAAMQAGPLGPSFAT